MKIHTVFLTLGLLALSSIAAAENIDVAVNGGVAAPGKYVSLSMDNLANDVMYDLSCVIRSDNYSGRAHEDILVTTYDENVGPVTVNQIDVKTKNGHGTLTFPLNTFKAQHVRKGNRIVIRNLERVNTVTVERCIATQLS